MPRLPRLVLGAFAAAFVSTSAFAQATPDEPAKEAPLASQPGLAPSQPSAAALPPMAEVLPPPAAATGPVALLPEPITPATAAAASEPAPATKSDEMSPSDPLAGWSGDTVYLRSADNDFVLMPGGRLQVDGYFFKRDTDKLPAPSILLRRARIEVAGWVGRWAFYNIGGDFALGSPSAADPVAQSWLNATDNFVGIAPWQNLAMLQVGQFDAPFTFENRTADKYFDFMERSLAVRAFGIPSNKESGVMVHGLLPHQVAYYSLGVFNGDGQNFRNVDSHFDAMGRAWIAPFAFANVKGFENIALGGSFWVGSRGPAAGTDSSSALRLASQSTQGGLAFLDSAWTIASPSATGGAATATPAEVHQRGKTQNFAAELNVPVHHRYGVRFEYVHKLQDLSVDNATKPAALVSLATAQLKGWAMYGEAWLWVLGDDTILPAPGLELPTRLKKFETTAPQDGVMLAARFERLDETVKTNRALATDPLSGARKIGALEFGVNYWHSKRYRATFNYVLNFLNGSAGGIDDARAKLAGHKNEHEFLFRLGIAL
jgi:hypothetical protein